jgi:uncharacterized membrane-anchored protein YitT (DUF2179 family)/predicted metal-dependent HD superfamily phosphohydrolase
LKDLLQGDLITPGTTLQFEEARTFILEKLLHELPGYLSYHNVQHTKDVLQLAEELAASENVTGDELLLLRTAALFHDTGYLEAYTGHEEISRSIAETFLPQFGYSDEAIKQIGDLIMATRIPQQPGSRLAQILCDADLYYLGTGEYTPKAENLYQELHYAGLIKSRDEWLHQQIKFLQTHHYFTPSAVQALSGTQHQILLNLQSLSQTHKAVTSHKDFYFSDILLIIVGVITAAFALKGFLVPNNFFDGGVTGISLLIHEITHFNLAYVIVLANLPFIIMGFYSVSVKFAAKTFFCIVFLGICLLYFPYPVITSDKLLVSIFGGFFLGLGIGLTMRGGCAVDGIEVLALYTWRRTSFTISEIILALNVIIFSIAAFKFGIQTALYSMLTYFTASKTVDYVIEGVEAYTGVTIISGKSEIIKDRLVNELGRGITVYKGERGYLPGKFEMHNDCDIIFTVITRLEMRKLTNLVEDIDPNAFVFASTIKQASGGVIKRRHIH